MIIFTEERKSYKSSSDGKAWGVGVKWGRRVLPKQNSLVTN